MPYQITISILQRDTPCHFLRDLPWKVVYNPEGVDMSGVYQTVDIVRLLETECGSSVRKVVIKTGADVGLLKNVAGRFARRWLNDPTIDEFKPLKDSFKDDPSSDRRPQPMRTWLSATGLPGSVVTRDAILLGTWYPEFPGGHDSWLITNTTQREKYGSQFTHILPRMRVFWTRPSGEWVVWVNYPDSRAIVAKDVDSLLDAIRNLTPNGAQLSADCMRGVPLDSPSLDIAKSILYLINRSRTKIDERYKSMVQDHDEINTMVRMTFPPK